MTRAQKIEKIKLEAEMRLQDKLIKIFIVLLLVAGALAARYVQ